MTSRTPSWLLAVGLLSASLGISSGETGGLPTSKLVVQAGHTTWPDGSPVESGGLNYPLDIYAVDASGKHIRNLTHDNPTNYLIDRFPKTQRILYESVPSDRMRAGRPRISSINVDGTGRRQLAWGAGARLAPDGRRILFGRGRWLYLMRSDGTHQTRLAQANFGYYVSPVAPVAPYDASWSPDGKRVAFVRGFAEHQAYGGPMNPRSAIFVINADGTGLHQLTKVRQKVQTMNPTWASDGSKMIFDEHSYVTIATTDRTYVMRADGTGVKRIKQLEGRDWHWLPNGRIAYQDGSRFQSIDPDRTGKTQALPGRLRVGGDVWIASGPAVGFWPVSPDGKWFAFMGRGVSIAHLDGTHRRLVTRKICCFFGSVAIEWAGK